MSLEHEMRDPRYINFLLFGNAITCFHVFRLTFAGVQSSVGVYLLDIFELFLIMLDSM
ncbi:hypothetical protein Scep_014164 [Stephania cephalantha]|uniref:Uncharacterized protein n=1 Tax=Stephania cephalantha TaxID=152367 RepID=A0AAP0P035_9MAGN